MGRERTYYEAYEGAQFVIEELKDKIRIMRNALEELASYDETPDRLPMIEQAKETLDKVEDLG